MISVNWGKIYDSTGVKMCLFAINKKSKKFSCLGGVGLDTDNNNFYNLKYFFGIAVALK